MQTKITNEMPFLKPGTHAAGYPYRADAALANADITFGTPVKAVTITDTPIKEGIAAMAVEPATNATFIGIAVAPDEHVVWKLPDDQAVYKVQKGDTIGVARKGAWAVALPADAQTISGTVTKDPEGNITNKPTITTSDKLVIGGKLYVNASGKIVLASDGATELGEIRDFRIDENATGKAGTESEGSTQWVLDEPAKGGVVVVLK